MSLPLSFSRHFTSAPNSEGEVDAAAAPGLTKVLDRIGFGRVQAALILLLMAGLFFDSLEQNSTGAMGPLLKETFGIGNTELTMINTVTVVGGLVGRLIGGYLADKYGRRFALSLNLLVYTLGGLISAVAVNYEMLLASRFIVGIGLGGEFTVGLAILSEIMATRYRGSMTATLNLASGGFGNLVSFGFFWLVLGPLNDSLGGNDTSWRWTYVILAVPAILVVWFRRYLPESPRFLLSKGRIEEANHSLTRLASGSIAGLRNPGPTQQFVTADDIPLQTKSSYAEVFKGRNLRRTVAVGAASWMSFGAQVTLLFLMPILLMSRGYSLSDSLAYTMFMHIGSVFGALTASLLAGKVQRRTAVGAAAVGGCIAAISFAAFADSAWKIVVLGMIFKYFTMMTNTLLSVWSPELFPTSVRAMGTSVVNGIGNVAGAVMPFAALFFFDRWGVPGVFTMIAVMYVLLFISSRFGPETFGKSLEEVSERKRVLTPA